MAQTAPRPVQADPWTLKGEHTTSVLPVRAISGNRELVGIRRLLEEQQHALQEIYSHVSNRRRVCRV
jgi:hypothetical protein